MKLFLYDEKHDNIIAQMDVEDSTEDVVVEDSAENAILGVINFLAENNITNRYSSLVLADDYKKIEDDGEKGEMIVFINQRTNN